MCSLQTPSVPSACSSSCPRPRPTRNMNKSALAQETSPSQRATRLTAVPKPLPLRSVLVSVMVADPGQRTFWTILISSPGSQGEGLVGGVHHVATSRGAGVGVKHRAALVFVEDADPPPVQIQRAGIGSAIVVEPRSIVGFLGGKRHVIVKVEIARSRGEPLEAPSHPLFERLDLGQGRPGNGYKGRIAVIEVNTAPIECVGPERAGRTPFLPLRIEHKVIDDELAPAFEEFGQRLLPFGPIEDIRLVHLLPPEGAPLLAQLVPKPREFLFLRSNPRSVRESPPRANP